MSVNTGVHATPHAYAARVLIVPSDFTWTDYSAFTAPGGADASDGDDCWHNCVLVVPNAAKQGFSTSATCGDCHAIDGTDLKYFAYENEAIRARSMFHGLSAQKGDNIAAYIRGLNVERPPMGYPWSPLYQPGPGIDSQAWWYWSAGAGVDSILMYSNDWMRCVAPGGSTTQWYYNGNFPIRTCPLMEQFFVWNKWLPAVYGPDVFPTADFATVETNLALLRSSTVAGKQTGSINTSATTLVMTANFACSTSDVLIIEDEAIQVTGGCGTTSLTITRHTNGTSAASHTDANVGDFTKYLAWATGTPSPSTFPYGPYRSSVAVTANGFPSNGNTQGDIPGVDPITFDSLNLPGYQENSPFLFNFHHAVRQFDTAKMWDIGHTKYIEGMLALYLTNWPDFGPCTTCPGGAYPNKGLVGTFPFLQAFHFSVTGTGHQYNPYHSNQLYGSQTNIWYVFAMVFYNGAGRQTGNSPIDKAYLISFQFNDQSLYSPPVGPELSLCYNVCPQMEAQNTQVSPPFLAQVYDINASFFQLTALFGAYDYMSDAEMTAYYTTWADSVLAYAGSQTDMQWTSWAASPPSGLEILFTYSAGSPTGACYTINCAGIANGIAYMIPQMVYWGVNSTKIDNLQAFGNLVAPLIDWPAQRAATCSVQGGHPHWLKCSNVP